MSNISASLTFSSFAVPAGKTPGNVLVTLTNDQTPPVTQTQVVPDGTATVAFANVAPGNWTATAVLLDSTGVALSTPTPVSNMITIALNVNAPATVVLALA